MKLKNRKNGKIVELQVHHIAGKCYESLADVNKDWEDVAEEPKQSALRSMILTLTNFIENEPSDNVDLDDCKDLLEKLKAWKRLKDKGLSFRHWKEAPLRPHSSCIAITGNMECDVEARKDLDLLFGGEE